MNRLFVRAMIAAPLPVALAAPERQPLRVTRGISPAGQTVYYQVRYRTPLSLCGTSAFGTTNVLELNWIP